MPVMPAAPFTSQSLSFFRQLARNNKREWFQPRKDKFDELIRWPMVALVEQVNDDLRKFAVDYVAADPAKMMYRIYRDTRFSKDKTPYKTHIAVQFQHRLLPKNQAAGMYFSVSHTGVDVGGGIYMPGPEELLAVRQAIARKPAVFEKLATDRAVVREFGPLRGDAVARVPKAFAPDHPAAERLRMKQYYFNLTLDPSLALKSTFRADVIRRFKRLLPMVDWLNQTIVATLKSESTERPRRPEPMF